MHLFQAIDTIRERVIGLRASERTDMWSAILKQIRKNKYIDNRYATAIEEIIRALLAELDDDTVIALWQETETGIAEDADDEVFVADCVRMDLEMELLDAITQLAYAEAEQQNGLQTKGRARGRKQRGSSEGFA